MVKFGVNMWVWHYPFNLKAIENAAKIGFDGVEIPVEDPKIIDIRSTSDTINSLNIECSSLCAVLSSERDIKNPDKMVRENAKKYLRTSIDLAVEFETQIVSGPIYSEVAPTLVVPEKEKEWKIAVEELKEVAKYAEDKDVYLGIEPINRFENHLINTVDEALRFIDEVNSPNVKMHYDTFHGNIEEKSIGDSIRKCGDLLCHVHTCENDRGTPGSGHIPWREVVDALKDIKYDRYCVIETFQPGIKEIAVAASIWRKLALTQDDLARDGLTFLKSIFS